MKVFIPIIVFLASIFFLVPHISYSPSAPTAITSPEYNRGAPNNDLKSHNINVSSWTGDRNAELHLTINMNGRTFFDVYENGGKIVQITKTKDQNKQIAFHAQIYESNLKKWIDVTSFRYARQETNGKWVAYPGHTPSGGGSYDLAVEFAIGGIDNGSKINKDGFGITLIKYPTLKYQFNPFGVWSPWKVGIQTDDFKKEITKYVVTHYQRFYFSL